ncbi:MAG: hypothetical protein COV36_07620 [Alphaproteobacteria bacterium CG11_big_fil_rev_8_21_14_0_20_44_7]|nr:MAG: hypothetical protein COV36_07620 [Alphaproteobacteria bacterium CG11_big_fil_rev_8_21_14_0_20_44_7]
MGNDIYEALKDFPPEAQVILRENFGNLPELLNYTGEVLTHPDKARLPRSEPSTHAHQEPLDYALEENIVAVSITGLNLKKAAVDIREKLLNLDYAPSKKELIAAAKTLTGHIEHGDDTLLIEESLKPKLQAVYSVHYDKKPKGDEGVNYADLPPRNKALYDAEIARRLDNKDGEKPKEFAARVNEMRDELTANTDIMVDLAKQQNDMKGLSIRDLAQLVAQKAESKTRE